MEIIHKQKKHFVILRWTKYICTMHKQYMEIHGIFDVLLLMNSYCDNYCCLISPTENYQSKAAVNRVSLLVFKH